MEQSAHVQSLNSATERPGLAAGWWQRAAAPPSGRRGRGTPSACARPIRCPAYRSRSSCRYPRVCTDCEQTKGGASSHPSESTQSTAPRSADGSTSNTASSAAGAVAASDLGRTSSTPAPAGLAGQAEPRRDRRGARSSDAARPTTADCPRARPNRTCRPESLTSAQLAGQAVVPPAGFEPALPPPETGRSRDGRRLQAFYLGFLFASCVSGGRLCAEVRSTRHSTPTVLCGRLGGLVLGVVSVVLAVEPRERKITGVHRRRSRSR